MEKNNISKKKSKILTLDVFHFLFLKINYFNSSFRWIKLNQKKSRNKQKS